METLRIGHSPDADDAFMFYAFAAGKVTIDGFQVEQVLEDIESLNKRAFQGELEVTAISAASYPLVADQYRIMVCGSSIGRNYGPILLGKGGGPQSCSRPGGQENRNTRPLHHRLSASQNISRAAFRASVP